MDYHQPFPNFKLSAGSSEFVPSSGVEASLRGPPSKEYGIVFGAGPETLLVNRV